MINKKDSHMELNEGVKTPKEHISRVRKAATVFSIYVAWLLWFAPSQVTAWPETNIIVPSAEKSGITPENITRVKMQWFLNDTNRILAYLDKEDSKYVTYMVTKQIVIKNDDAWRVSLIHGNKSTHFTLIAEKNSNEYKIISSQESVIKWAKGWMKKWGAL